MERHVQGLTQRPEEVGDELRTSIGGDVRRNSVFREHMEDEELGELRGGDGVVSRDKDRLFRESVNNDEDCCITGGGRELLNEIHGDGIPRLLRDRKLFKTSIWSVTGSFSSVTTSAGLTEILNKVAKSGPGVLSSDQVDSLVLSEVSSGRMIVLVSENSKSEIFRVRYINTIVFPEETIGVQRPSGIGFLGIEMGKCEGIGG